MTITTPDIDALNAAIDAQEDNRANATTRLILADALDDAGDHARAEGYRAMAAWGLRTDYYGAKGAADGKEAYCFWVRQDANVPVRSTLPDDWFSLMRGSRTPDHLNKRYRNYDTRRECEDACALAFSELPQERREFLAKGPHRE